MVYLYLSSVIGFICYAAVFAWKKFEASKNDFAILTAYLQQGLVILFYSGIFGIFGVIYNLDAVKSTVGMGLLAKLAHVPSMGPIVRSFSVGVAGPLAAAQLFASSMRHSVSRDGGGSVDDITNEPPRNHWFTAYSKLLFFISVD